VFIPLEHNAGQKCQKIKTAGKAFDKVAKFKYLGTGPTNQNCTHEELKECLLPFPPETSVIIFATEVYKH
jgi:hypothetical protein